jgi:hypothetical protein
VATPRRAASISAAATARPAASSAKIYVSMKISLRAAAMASTSAGK